MSRKRVLSCIQPTGGMHIGNYFGAIKSWVDLQKENDCAFGIVDYHALTVTRDPETLRQMTDDMIINLLACGIHKENIFVQSYIPEHTEMCWIFSCLTNLDELYRQSHFNSKKQYFELKSVNKRVSSGLFNFPILQASDILIHKTQLVPIGKDLEQHLDLTTTIADRFNSEYAVDFFISPTPIFTSTPSIMSLTDSTKKMSKSLGKSSYVSLFDTRDDIVGKIKAIPEGGPSDDYSQIKNLISILELSNEKSIFQHYLNNFEDGMLDINDLKEDVCHFLVELTDPFLNRRNELIGDINSIQKNIRDSSMKFRKRAQINLLEIKELIGLRV